MLRKWFSGWGRTEESRPPGNGNKIQITPRELQERLGQGTPPVLLDVREPWEFQKARIEGSVLIPLRELPHKMEALDREAEIVVLCHHGVRSMQAIRFLSRTGFTRLRNLAGGIDAWSTQADPSVPRYS